MKKIGMLFIKRLFIACLIFVAPVAIAELAYNEQTKKFYSKKASKNVNQEEYNFYCQSIMQSIWPRGFIYLTKTEIAVFFFLLRLEGTPAALCLIHDLEQAIKTIKKDIKTLNNL